MGNENINPAWKPMLDKLPLELQSLVVPIFAEWDQGVQKKFQDIRNEYTALEPFKKFAESNIDPEYIQQAVILADQLQRDPGKIVAQVNEAWNLGYVSKDDAAKLGQSVSPPEGIDLGDFDDTDDIFKNPKVKAMQDALNQLQTDFTKEKDSERQNREIQEFEDYLDDLETQTTEKNLPFHRTFVTALISQGMDGDAAVKQYHQVLASQTVNGEVPPPVDEIPPPVVMGSEGSMGSGSPDGSVDFGSLSNKDLNKTVQDLLTQALDGGQ